jgi:hypothetical protein
MRVKGVSVSYDRKFNLGDYQSIRLEAVLWCELEDGDEPAACVLELQGLARKAVKAEFLRLKKKGTAADGE